MVVPPVVDFGSIAPVRNRPQRQDSAVQEVDDMNPQRMSDKEQVAEFHLGAGLHPLDRRPVDAARVGEGLLGHVLVEASHADAVADRAAGRGDPLGLIGWHATNRLRTKIISQQQVCGIF